MIHPRKRLLLDTNLLLLWLVARTNPRVLFEFKRVQNFLYADIVLLREIVARHGEHVTTPHLLSETSNFVDQAPFHRRELLTAELRDYIHETHEVYYPAIGLSDRPEFTTFGLSDSALFALDSDVVVVTTDYHLASAIAIAGGDSIYFAASKQ